MALLPDNPTASLGPPRRPYWSERQGRGPAGRVNLEQLCILFAAVVDHFEEKDLLQEWFGYSCVDAGDVPGLAGRNVAGWLMIQIGRSDVWPVREHSTLWDEDTLFDMVELLHDHISTSTDGHYHSWCDCGWHGSSFTPEPARSNYREMVNRLLARYGSGYRLSEEGCIEHLGPAGIDDLLDAAPQVGDKRDRDRVRDAVAKFRRRSSTPTDRRDAVRDLADVLERLRPQMKAYMLRKDEGALFQIANQFTIRHNDAEQRGDYDTDVWWEWMFSVYLATYYAIASIGTRDDEAVSGVDAEDLLRSPSDVGGTRAADCWAATVRAGLLRHHVVAHASYRSQARTAAGVPESVVPDLVVVERAGRVSRWLCRPGRLSTEVSLVHR